MLYAESKRIPITVTREKPYSTDRNLVHISYEGGILENPWNAPREDMFQLTVSPELAPDEPEVIEIGIERIGGVPEVQVRRRFFFRVFKFQQYLPVPGAGAMARCRCRTHSEAGSDTINVFATRRS